MNKIKACLHIGTHKTGSTAIQNFCRRNANDLRKNNFLWVNESYGTPHKLLQDFKYRSFSVRNLNKSSRFLVELASRTKNKLLLSGERFSGSPESGYQDSQFLARSAKYLLRDFEVKVLVYIRPQDSFYESWYTQMVQQGTAQQGAISSHFKKFWKDFSFQNINYQEVINAYAEAFGASNLIVRPYMKSKLKDRNVIHDFLDIIEFNDITSLNFDVPFANNSISASALKIMNSVNKARDEGRISESERARVRSLLQSTNSKREWEHHRYLKPSQRREILEYFEDQNYEICTKWFGFDDNLWRFSDSSQQDLNRENDSDELNIEDLAEVNMRILENVNKLVLEKVNPQHKKHLSDFTHPDTLDVNTLAELQMKLLQYFL